MDTNGASEESMATDSASGGDMLIECALSANADLVLTMEPGPREIGPTMVTRIDCSVTEVAGGDPAVLRMACVDGLEMFEWRLDAAGLQTDLSSTFTVGQAIDLHYYSTEPEAPNLTQWAVLRAPDDDEPLFVVTNASTMGFPVGLAPLEIDIVTDTTCNRSPGSCGVGSMGRAALRFSNGNEKSVLVFDHNNGHIGTFDIQLGDAIFDESDCDGVTANRYEFVLWRGVESP